MGPGRFNPIGWLWIFWLLSFPFGPALMGYWMGRRVSLRFRIPQAAALAVIGHRLSVDSGHEFPHWILCNVFYLSGVLGGLRVRFRAEGGRYWDFRHLDWLLLAAASAVSAHGYKWPSQ